MAKLEKKNVNPIVAALANFCCFGVLGYILVGQTSKALFVFLVAFVLNAITFGTVGTIIVILGCIDVMQVAQAVEKGEEVDELEYKLEILHKIMSIIQKDAIFKKAA